MKDYKNRLTIDFEHDGVRLYHKFIAKCEKYQLSVSIQMPYSMDELAAGLHHLSEMIKARQTDDFKI